MIFTVASFRPSRAWMRPRRSLTPAMSVMAAVQSKPQVAATRSRSMPRPAWLSCIPVSPKWALSRTAIVRLAGLRSATYVGRRGGLLKTCTGPPIKLRAIPLRSAAKLPGCDFTRSRGTCAQPAHYPACPLPSLPLRNGNLNRMAYGLSCSSGTCARATWSAGSTSGYRLSQPNLARLPGAVRPGLDHAAPPRLWGLDKVLSMTLADLLIGADPDRSLWGLAGRHMIAVDTLIHNLLHRTGTLAHCDAEHAYGPGCYALGLRCHRSGARDEIDARAFDPSFPSHIPPVCAARPLGLLRPRRAGCLQRQPDRRQPGLSERLLPRVRELRSGTAAAGVAVCGGMTQAHPAGLDHG